MMLHVAVMRRHFDIIPDYLRSGVQINSTDDDGCTPLHVAAKNKMNNMVYALICLGADVNIKNRNGNIPEFRYSADSGDVDFFLQFRGTARLNPILLRIAAQVRDIKIVEVLLQRRSLSIDTPDIHGQTAIYLTAYREPIFKSSSNKNETPLSDGVEADIARMLLDKGSKVDIQTCKGFTTLHAAIENEYFKLIDTLLEYDANVNSKTYMHETPLHVSVRKNFEPISQWLLSRGADANAKLTYFQITPLHIAAYNCNENIAKLLLRFGAKLDCKTQFDLTPLHIATIMGSLKIVELLLEFGVDMDAKDEFGRTALHIASKNRHGTIISALLNHGADINIISSDNCTPFYYAAVDVSYLIRDSDRRALEITFMILEYHILKMRALNLFVSEKLLEFVEYKGKINNGKHKCETEIQNMKNEMIDQFVSFYDILTNDKLATKIRYEKIAGVLKSKEYKIKFPIYADLIEINLMKRKRRNSLLQQIGSNVFGLPNICHENILSYLEDKDLLVLVEAFNPINDEVNSSNMFEKIRTPQMVKSIRTSINSFTYDSNDKELLKEYHTTSSQIYLTEVRLMFTYFERICSYKCNCKIRKCNTLYTVT